MRDCIFPKCARGLGRPIQFLPINRVEALKATYDNRINPQIFFFRISLRPSRIVCTKSVLFPIGADPVIDNVINLKLIAKPNSQIMYLLKRVCPLQSLQKFFEFQHNPLALLETCFRPQWQSQPTQQVQFLPVEPPKVADHFVLRRISSRRERR
jgi:hypothetical protein